MQTVKLWVKKNPNPIAQLIRSNWIVIKTLELPSIPLLHSALYQLHNLSIHLLQELARRLYWTPLFKSQIQGGKHLYLYSGMPQVISPLEIKIGRNCRISGISTFSGRWCSTERPQLIVGDNVDIGWQTSIAVASKVILEDNVRMAGRAFLAGYPGHPINPQARAEGAPDMVSQTGPIHLKKNVWLGTGVTVLPGVTIGENTVVGTGSIVTHSLPENVIAAGNPARVVRQLTPDELATDRAAADEIINDSDRCQNANDKKANEALTQP